MDSNHVSLNHILSELQTAIEQQDWEGAEALDASIREKLKAAIARGSEGQNNTELIDMLKKTQHLYDQLIVSSEQSRSELSGELKKIANESKAAKFYLKSSQYR